MALSSAQFSDPKALRALSEQLWTLEPDRPLRFMHVCGTHEHAMARFGLRALLPPWLRVIAGPGCPVCVCPPEDIEAAADAATNHDAVVATFGDMVAVPARRSLAETRAAGGDIRVVASAAQAVAMARRERHRTVVLFAVGFETTACTTAAALGSEVPENFAVLLSHRLIPPALVALLGREDLAIDGFLMPGHVHTVTGLGGVAALSQRSGKPMVIAGFEPLDVLVGLRELVSLAISGRAEAVNAYRRAVRAEGNKKALAAMERVFRAIDARWRGLGTIADSGLALQPGFARFDARERLGLAHAMPEQDDLPGCRCAEVMVGRSEPETCGLFAGPCTPDAPRGPCMVSVEGTCRSRFLFRELTEVAR